MATLEIRRFVRHGCFLKVSASKALKRYQKCYLRDRFSSACAAVSEVAADKALNRNPKSSLTDFTSVAFLLLLKYAEHIAFSGGIADGQIPIRHHRARDGSAPLLGRSVSHPQKKDLTSRWDDECESLKSESRLRRAVLPSQNRQEVFNMSQSQEATFVNKSHDQIL